METERKECTRPSLLGVLRGRLCYKYGSLQDNATSKQGFPCSKGTAGELSRAA